MAPKRPLSDPPSAPSKKPRTTSTGFRVGPANLPDGAWKRKVTKIKADLITKAKVKKQYAKVKSQVQTSERGGGIPVPGEEADPVPLKKVDGEGEGEGKEVEEIKEPEIHPERLARLDEPEPEEEVKEVKAAREPREPRERRKKNKQRKPDYYAKALSAAAEAKAAADARAAEIARRQAEKEKAIADREQYRKKMAKAKTPGRDGRVKIGRESQVLLDRVKRIVEGK